MIKIREGEGRGRWLEIPKGYLKIRDKGKVRTVYVEQKKGLRKREEKCSRAKK